MPAMSLPNHSQALVYEQHGKATEVLTLRDIPLRPLLDDEVLLKILAAPINPADIGKIGGSYGELATPPAVGGIEGIATVEATGGKVSQWKTGDRIIAPGSRGTWQSHVIAKANELFRGPRDESVEQAAMAWVNPTTAWKLLHGFADLKSGDWIIQNAATSGVGKLVIQFAHSLGIKTINLARNLSQSENLTALGATLVAIDDDASVKAALKDLGLEKPKLALNAVGGLSAYRMTKGLANQATLVTYGGMDRNAAPFPTRYLIFNDISLRGFWSHLYYQTTPREDIDKLLETVYQFMEVAAISVDVAQTYPLNDFQEAIAHANSAGKSGKVLFKMN